MRSPRSIAPRSRTAGRCPMRTLQYLAAAVKREAAGHVLGPMPGDILDKEEPAYQPFRPLVLGTPLERLLSEAGVDVGRYPAPGFGPSAFIVVGLGYPISMATTATTARTQGHCTLWASPNSRPRRRLRRRPRLRRLHPRPAARPQCETPAFLAWMQATLRAAE
jgi:hypothetical protein